MAPGQILVIGVLLALVGPVLLIRRRSQLQMGLTMWGHNASAHQIGKIFSAMNDDQLGKTTSSGMTTMALALYRRELSSRLSRANSWEWNHWQLIRRELNPVAFELFSIEEQARVAESRRKDEEKREKQKQRQEQERREEQAWRDGRREPMKAVLQQLKPAPPSHSMHKAVGDLSFEKALDIVLSWRSHNPENEHLIYLGQLRRDRGFSTDSPSDFDIHEYRVVLTRADDQRFVIWEMLEK